MNIKAILVGVALFGAAADAAANMPVAFSTMTYQGRLKESGVAVTGNRDVRIYVCNAFTGGLCFSDTPAQSVAVADGVFKTTFTLPSGVDLATGNWFLEAAVGPVGGGLTTLSPREKLTSSAYAVASAMTLNANSVPAEGVAPGILGTGVNFADKVGIGTPSPAAVLHVSSPGANGGSYVMKVTTGSTDVLSIRGDGRVSFHAGLAPEYAASVMFGDWVHGDPNSVVGIGHPTGKVLTLATQEDSMSNIGTVSIKFGQMNLQDMAEIKAVNEGGAATLRTAGLSFLTEPPGTGQPVVERLRIAGSGHVVVYSTLSVQGSGFSVGGSTLVVTSGRVGIGVANPVSPLDIAFPGTSGIRVNSTDGSAPSLKLFQAGAEKTTFHANSTDSYLGTADTSKMHIITNNLSRMTVDSSGNFGIGTAGPATKLDVAGDAQFGSGAAKSTFTAAGNLLVPGSIGISTGAPSASLHIHAAGANGVHLKATQGTAPTVGVPASCGGSPGASILAGSTDMAGRLTITSGSLSPTTCDTVITFRQPLGAAPKAVLFTAATSTASYRNIYVSNMGSGADFTVSFSSNPPASVGMDWSYFVIE